MDILLVILTTFLVTQCASTSTDIADSDIDNVAIYSVDRDGLYQYDQSNDKTIKIADIKEIFIDNSLQFINDTTIIIGHKGEMIKDEKPRQVYSNYFYQTDGDSSWITDNPPYTVYDEYTYYTTTFYSIDLKNRKNWKYKTIEYVHKDMDTLTIKTTIHDQSGKTISVHDSITNCSSISSSSDGITFCGNNERFYSESNLINDRQVFSKKGNLYLRENGKEKLLLEFDGHFDPKFGSGYFQPTLAPNGEKVVFKFLAGFLKSGSGLFELDLKTMDKKEITDDDYFQPEYSPDGNFLLLGKNQRQDKSNKTWINDIYILDLKTNKTKKVGEGDLFIWKK